MGSRAFIDRTTRNASSEGRIADNVRAVSQLGCSWDENAHSPADGVLAGPADEDPLSIYLPPAGRPAPPLWSMLAPARAPGPRTSSSLARPGRLVGGVAPGAGEYVGIVVIAAGLCLVPAFVSYLQALTGPSNSTVGIRSVEWLRDNGARGLVNRVENIYYSLNAPSTGGPALRTLQAKQSELAAAGVARRLTVHYYRPPRIRPLTHPALPGEGVWHATFADGGSRPPVLVTSFRSDPLTTRRWSQASRGSTTPGRPPSSTRAGSSRPWRSRPRADGGAARARAAGGGDVQQRLQAAGLGWRIRRGRTRVCADEAGAGHVRRATGTATST